MEEDKPNEYEGKKKSDEDFEEEVIEETTDPMEETLDDDIKKIGTIKSGEEIKEEDVEIDESEEIKEDIKEEPIVDDPVIEEEPEEIKEKLEPTLEIEEDTPKEKPIIIPVKKAKKPRVVAKRSKTRKVSIKKKVAVKIAEKRNPTKKRKKHLYPVVYSIIGIAIIILAIFLLTKTTPTVTAAAIVNGNEISIDDLNKEYEFFFLIGGLPEEYKQQITKELFLNSTLIPEKLVLAEAEKNNIQVTEDEVNTFVKNSVEKAGSTMENFESTINSLDLTLETIKNYFKKQLISFKLLNATILADIDVSDTEIENAYNKNKDLFGAQNQTFEEIKEDLRNALLIQKQRTAAQIYMNQLVQNADITIYYLDVTTTTLVVEDVSFLEKKTEEIKQEIIEEVSLPESTAEIMTFLETGDSLCEEDGKPIIRMYSASWDEYSNWAKEKFDIVVNEYIKLEKITAYHWQLDTGDNSLTSEVELIPKSEVEIFKKYNPDLTVPTFIFGCKYSRVGNGYETEDNLAAEESEFKAVINSLI